MQAQADVDAEFPPEDREPVVWPADGSAATPAEGEAESEAEAEEAGAPAEGASTGG
jgi:hypothetical protein